MYKNTHIFLIAAAFLTLLILISLSLQLPEKETTEVPGSEAVDEKTRALFKRGRNYLHRGEYHAAVDTLQVVLEENPKHLGALRAIGFAYFRKGDKEKALSYWNEAMKQNPEDATVNALVKSIEQGTKDITHPPDPSDSKRKMPQIKSQTYFEGDRFFREGNYPKAIEKFKEALKTLDNDFRVYFALGAAYREIEMIEDAALNWEKAVELSPKNSMVKMMLRMIKEKLNQKKEIEDLKKQLKEKPGNWEIHLMLSEKYLLFNKGLTTQGSPGDKYLKKAYEELKTVFNFQPTHLVSIKKLINLSVYLERYEEAIRYQESLAKLEPGIKQHRTDLVLMKRFKKIVETAENGIIHKKKKISIDEKMAYIPEGYFLMGDDTSLKNREDEAPKRKVFLKGFYMDKFEVTYLQFKNFVENKGGYKTPVLSHNSLPPQRKYYPVSKVTYKEAEDYCQWAGKRLPTEEEWEKAARGVDGRKFPWKGNETDRNRNNTRLSAFYKSVPVGGYPEGVSPYGLFEMSGNLQEWTGSWYKRYSGSESSGLRDDDYGEKHRVLRGGSFLLDPLRATTTARNYQNPKYRGNDVGFRCAKDG